MHTSLRQAIWGLAVVASWATFGSLQAAPLDPSDWPHWRGPEQNGISRQNDLPERWSPDGENLLWSNRELATRSTPIVMHGRLYTICRAFPETTQEGERVVCVDAETGQLIWQTVNNVYLTDAPAERVGWSSVVGDPETGKVYALGLGCFFQCLDGVTGQRLWSESMSETYGMLSTYGGRTNFPVLFENLVIISGVTTGWGEQALPAHRIMALDKHTGQLVWVTSTRVRPEDTTYSTPIITQFDGQAALVFGAADGAVYALQPRTGRVLWKYQASTRGINTTLLVTDGIVFGGHSEQNAADTTVLGALFALDGRRQGEVTEGDLLWKLPGRTVGRSQPLLLDGRLYALDDAATLWIVDAASGKPVARQKLGRIMFGSMVAGDGKLYVAEATGRWWVLQPTDSGVRVLHQLRLNNQEILGSPIIARGRIYLPTSEALYCIGRPTSQPITPSPPVVPVEAALDVQDPIAHLQVVPAEVLLQPGGQQAFQVRAYNARGQFLRIIEAEMQVQGPGTIDSSGMYHAPVDPQHATAIVTARQGSLAAAARLRIVPPLPWKFDFSDQQVPSTWIGAAYRHQARTVDGEPMLVKISTIPKGTRSQLWMGPTHLHDYTVQADVRGGQLNDPLPEIGLVNQRYTLALLPSGQLQLRSWTSRLELRFAHTVPFSWQPNTWYTVKFQSENAEDRVILRGKVWPRGTDEPPHWTIEAADATPNRVGSPGLFGNSSDAEIFIDNVLVTAN